MTEQMEVRSGLLDKKPKQVFGDSPNAVFVLESGEQICVTHRGEFVEVRAVGKVGPGYIAVLPAGGNRVDVYPTIALKEK